MESHEIAVIGYATAMIVMAVLTVLLLSRWKGSEVSRVLAVASAASVVWGGAAALVNLGYLQSAAGAVLPEWFRSIAWLAALTVILGKIDSAALAERVSSRYGVMVFLVATLFFVYYVYTSDDPGRLTAVVSVGLLVAVIVLGLTEQIFRNAPADSESGLKYFCIAVSGIFLYDLMLFVAIASGGAVDDAYWAARGFVATLFAVPLSIGIWRSFRLSFDVQFPRQIVIYSFGLTAIGVYAVIIVIGQYYIRTYGGDWSGVARIVFIVAAIALVAMLFASPTTRARVRVFLMKTFFQFKYDYRREWLRFIATLSDSVNENVATTAVRAIAQIVHSPGGAVWVQERESEAYLPLGSWRSEIPAVDPIDGDTKLVRFLKDRQWIVDLEEMKRDPSRYEDLELVPWMHEEARWWLIVPLLLGNRLFGFLLLQRPRAVRSLNFEDHDLLRTVGRHVATYLDQAEADRRISESDQFGAYNRLTAFLMHDLNNLVAQLSLVVKNAERFRENPKFVDDAIETIAHSVRRMNRLMEQLTSRSQVPEKAPVDLGEVLAAALDRCSPRQPRPQLRMRERGISLQADSERLTTVFEHIIRNAQDATEEDGWISVEAGVEDGVADVSISDNGKGMTPEFIRERLFKPFDSTKGSHSMGIGAYQAREYVRTLGGQLDVVSNAGAGTTFRVRLPLTA